MHPRILQFIFSAGMGATLLLWGTWISGSTYLPALETAWNVTSEGGLGGGDLVNPALLKQIAGFAIAALAAHILFFLLPVLAQRTLFSRLPALRDSLPFSLILLLLLAIALFYINEHVFPNSAANVFGLKAGGAIPTGLSLCSLIVIGAFLACAVIYGISRAILHRPLLAAVGLAALLILGFVDWCRTLAPVKTGDPRSNVILIGIDSLRPDHVLDEPRGQALMPNLSGFLDDALILENASTVIARSYPAWITLFSGQYPHVSGIRYNLQQREHLNEVLLLPEFLQDQGYLTIFATDETRYANIDESFGFDHVISPPQGAADFVIIAFSDLPLVNALSNVWPFYWAFPHVSGNRQSKAYMPETFSAILEARLQRLLSGVKQPVLLVVDFDIAHWPYHASSWNLSTLFDGDATHYRLRDIRRRYESAVAIADQQFERLRDQLESMGILDEALVTVFSDHGENLGEDGSEYSNHTDLFIPFGSSGHGNTIFDESSHKVVLAFRDFRTSPVVKPGREQKSVELVDVVPSLLSALELGVHWSTSGNDILDHELDTRYRLRETGITLSSLKKDTINAVEVAEEAIENYTITRDGRLEIRENLHEQILIGKQRGLETGGVMLTYLPDRASEGLLEWVVVDNNRQEIHYLDQYPDRELAAMLHENFCRVYAEDPYFGSVGVDCDSFPAADPR